MRGRYDAETRAKAVRLYMEHVGDYSSPWAAMKAISGRLGMTAETLRLWVRQAEVDAGQRPGLSTESAAELRELRRKCRELEQTNRVPGLPGAYAVDGHGTAQRAPTGQVRSDRR